MSNTNSNQIQVYVVDHNTFRPAQTQMIPLQTNIPMGTQTGKETELFVNNDMGKSNLDRPQ